MNGRSSEGARERHSCSQKPDCYYTVTEGVTTQSPNVYTFVMMTHSPSFVRTITHYTHALPSLSILIIFKWTSNTTKGDSRGLFRCNTNRSNMSTHVDSIRTKHCTHTVHTLFPFKNYIARVYIFGKKMLKTVKSSYTETDNITSNL